MTISASATFSHGRQIGSFLLLVSLVVLVFVVQVVSASLNRLRYPSYARPVSACRAGGFSGVSVGCSDRFYWCILVLLFPICVAVFANFLDQRESSAVSYHWLSMVATTFFIWIFTVNDGMEIARQVSSGAVLWLQDSSLPVHLTTVRRQRGGVISASNNIRANNDDIEDTHTHTHTHTQVVQ
eukprot:GHVR01111644.1.p1 GENE.GHVR01111644.1~~GHVR01111644.1.p1  ORF type:complete len:195 (-),score=57.89 GHVR01111644.1:116-664(-)